MGNEVKSENIKKENNILFQVSNNIEKIDRNSFNIISLIGAGAYSKVWEVKWKKTDMVFAMKEMSKARIIDKKFVKAVISERDILSKINHPFIINLHFSFQDSNKLYLIMDLVKGKDLRSQFGSIKQMTEEQTKFLAGCVILGLEYLHYNEIAHRDLKPENIIFDEKGYAKITDFGLACPLNKIKKNESPGTFSYMAPEIFFGEEYDLSIDYYSLGIIVYECMKGNRPYIEINAKDTKEYLSNNQFSMKRHAVPEGWGIESADFINRLLLKNRKIRLGASGTKELKNHCWFRGFNFQDLYELKMKSPFDVKNTKAIIKIKTIDKETYKRYNKIMKSHEYKTVFKNFLYFNLYDQNLSKDFLNNPHTKIYNNKIKDKDLDKGKENNSKNIIKKNDDNKTININMNMNINDEYKYRPKGQELISLNEYHLKYSNVNFFK